MVFCSRTVTFENWLGVLRGKDAQDRYHQNPSGYGFHIKFGPLSSQHCDLWVLNWILGVLRHSQRDIPKVTPMLCIHYPARRPRLCCRKMLRRGNVLPPMDTVIQVAQPAPRHVLPAFRFRTSLRVVSTPNADRMTRWCCHLPRSTWLFVPSAIEWNAVGSVRWNVFQGALELSTPTLPWVTLNEWYWMKGQRQHAALPLGRAYYSRLDHPVDVHLAHSTHLIHPMTPEWSEWNEGALS